MAMNDRGTLWIVPDEKQIIQPLFKKKVGEGISHTKEMLNFVKTFKFQYISKSLIIMRHLV